MSTLDLVGISKLASLHMRKKKRKKIMMYYILSLLLGLLLPEATPAYGHGLSVPLVGPIVWAHQPNKN